ncbi:MAG: MTAP family purine nucleoside phosphorylase [Actinomycetota bacterium]|nr:MTAP family purine nucleoside phosphorylase [Actinomycetota bacterium]
MLVGVITGTGTYDIVAPDRSGPLERLLTRFGVAEFRRTTLNDVDVVHLSRHGEGHPRLSNHVNHRAHAAALRELGVDAVIGCTVCGAVDPEVALGSVVVFDDLHFTSNRLPDGSLCTLHVTPGERDRAHWIFDRPYSQRLREALVSAARAGRFPTVDGGCYGHVDGPRFNTAAEIRGLAELGVTAVSQTGGPETVLMGEAELPYALVGFPTDYANGVGPETPTVAALEPYFERSRVAFRELIAQVLPLLSEFDRPGFQYRFEAPAA